MATPEFPTLPASTASVFDQGTLEDPALKIEFENGVAEVRSRRSRARMKDMTVRYQVREEIADLILNFIRARRLSVEPFIFHHPFFGTGLVRYVGDELPAKIMVRSNPAWYEINLTLEEVL